MYTCTYMSMHRSSVSGQRPALVRLAASLLLAGVARAQVRNVRFEE